MWLHKYYMACINERSKRKGPDVEPHRSFVCIGEALSDICNRLEKQISALYEQTEPAEAFFPVINDTCGWVPEIYGSYRMSLIFKWVKKINDKDPPKWTNSDAPKWWKAFVNGEKS